MSLEKGRLKTNRDRTVQQSKDKREPDYQPCSGLSPPGQEIKAADVN